MVKNKKLTVVVFIFCVNCCIRGNIDGWQWLALGNINLSQMVKEATGNTG